MSKFCVTCGDPISLAVRSNSIFCDKSCGVKAGRLMKAGKKSWRFCGTCGHTEEMHVDARGRHSCMEPVGVNDEAFCRCTAICLPMNP